MITYRSLDILILQLIKKYTGKDNESMSSQYADNLLPYSANKNASSDETTEIVRELVDNLNNLVKPYIASGLEVTANDPPNDYVNVSSGAGIANGHYIELEQSLTLKVPLDGITNTFYINLDSQQVTIEPSKRENKLPLAKIVIPSPGTTLAIQDNKPSKTDGSYDGWIVSGNDVLFDGLWQFDDDSIAQLGNKLNYILAENIYGTINLSENLKISNTQGTLQADSKSLKLFYASGNLGSEFDKHGVKFYDENGYELAKFTSTEARIGNIIIEPNDIRSGNFVAGASGFKINDDGTCEFEDVTARGTIYASSGTIGGWTIDANKIYNTSTGASGIIQGGTYRTSADVGMGEDGVMLDIAGLRGYSALLGQVFNLPTDGSAPKFSSGIINETVFEISTNSVLRTSNTVGDGSSNSAGILINNTGIYGCAVNQLLNEANLRALISGTISLKGEIVATSGDIGSVTITETSLTGGLIEGAIIRGGVYENVATTPKIRIDNTGINFQVATTVGKYGGTGAGLGFKYGDGTLYGTGILASLFNTNYPTLSILAETTKADIRLYNRLNDPVAGSHSIGDFIVVSGDLKICKTAGSPGTFVKIFKEGTAVSGFIIENRTNDTGCTETGRMWLRTDI